MYKEIEKWLEKTEKDSFGLKIACYRGFELVEFSWSQKKLKQRSELDLYWFLLEACVEWVEKV